jgi:hypothetical protein
MPELKEKSSRDKAKEFAKNIPKPKAKSLTSGSTGEDVASSVAGGGAKIINKDL